MPNQVMGFEGMLYYGAAGSTATTLLENTRDITTKHEVERGDTTRRGDSTVAPLRSSRVTARIVGIEFVMLNDKTDAALEALKVAANAGTPVALRGKDHVAGKGPDGDFNLSYGAPWPLAGEQVITFTAEPDRSEGREPVGYV